MITVLVYSAALLLGLIMAVFSPYVAQVTGLHPMVVIGIFCTVGAAACGIERFNSQ